MIWVYIFILGCIITYAVQQRRKERYERKLKEEVLERRRRRL